MIWHKEIGLAICLFVFGREPGGRTISAVHVADHDETFVYVTFQVSFNSNPTNQKTIPLNSQQYFSCSAYTLREKQRLHRKPLSETNSGFHLEPTKKMKHPCIVASFRWSWWTLTYLSQYSTRIFRKQNNHSTTRSRLFFFSFFLFLICSFWTKAFNKKS